MRRLPRWLLIAALPSVLVVGVVVAALLWAYGPGIEPATGADPAVPGGTGATLPGETSPGPAGSGGDGGSEPVDAPGAGEQPGQTANDGERAGTPGGAPTTPPTPSHDTVPIVPRPSLGQSVTRFERGGPDQAYEPGGTVPEQPTVPASPGQAYGAKVPAGPPRNIDEAMQTLNREYSRTTIAGVTLVVHGYFPMESAVNGQILAGTLTAQDYPAWETLVREQPEELQQWLEEAAQRVAPAAAASPFQVSWALVDVIAGPPLGYAHHELTALADGRWLVVRPLAASVYLPESARVYLRPGSALAGAATKESRPWSDPWATYAPPADPAALAAVLER